MPRPEGIDALHNFRAKEGVSYSEELGWREAATGLWVFCRRAWKLSWRAGVRVQKLRYRRRFDLVLASRIGK